MRSQEAGKIPDRKGRNSVVWCGVVAVVWRGWCGVAWLA